MKPNQATIVKKNLLFVTKAIDEVNHIIRGVFSTSGEDRHGEIVDQNGWKLEEYMANPVILFAHDHYTPAVGKCLELTKDGNGNLEGAIQFAVEEDTSGLAATLWGLYSKKFMRAFSVGFQNDLYEVDQETDTIILRENTLFEISCVNVPANAMALAKGIGMDMTSIEKFAAEAIAKQMLSDANIDEISKRIAKQLQPKKQVTSADRAEAKTQHKVETPRAKGSHSLKRRLNKNVRRLLKKKRSIV